MTSRVSWYHSLRYYNLSLISKISLNSIGLHLWKANLLDLWATGVLAVKGVMYLIPAVENVLLIAVLILVLELCLCAWFAAHDQIQVHPIHVRQSSLPRQSRYRENSRLVNHTCQNSRRMNHTSWICCMYVVVIIVEVAFALFMSK